MMELVEAIHKQKKGKTPGTDGLPSEFYHKFQDILTPLLKDLFARILDGNKIPDFWRYSTTTLILKRREGKRKYC